MSLSPAKIVQELAKRGVLIRGPASLDIDPSVDLDRIAAGVVLHAGCRLTGEDTSIGPGCVLGEEAPVTLDNCQLADRVALKGGYFSGAVFLSDVTLASCAHVRPGTLLEEQAAGGHSVGLKQTVLMPFVTMGSLINFCDCLMAGGASRSRHSEVGSSYVHFNFTPRQDKATASLLGDVPRGVMLDQPPIFLGGQGGLVGPVRIEYGTVIAAGTVCRRDIARPGRLVFGETGRRIQNRPYEPGAYGDIARIVAANLAYLGNLHALRQWYLHVRSRFMLGSPFDAACHAGARTRIEAMIAERIVRMNELASSISSSPGMARRRSPMMPHGRPDAIHRRLAGKWPRVAEAIGSFDAGNTAVRRRDAFLGSIGKMDGGKSYLDGIKALDPAARRIGAAWLRAIVDAVVDLW